MNVGQILTLTAKKFLSRIAILFENQRFNYQEFNHRVNQFSDVLLKMGLREGEEVAILLINSPAFIETEVLGENHI
jgi:non-ribosomal peptide synthetase component E (peptide arylation enzyme)